MELLGQIGMWDYKLGHITTHLLPHLLKLACIYY